jgi:hypothetical protein
MVREALLLVLAVEGGVVLVYVIIQKMLLVSTFDMFPLS